MGRRSANSDWPASFIQKCEKAETSGLFRLATMSAQVSGPSGDEVCQVKISSIHRLCAWRFHRRSTAAASTASQRPRCRGPDVVMEPGWSRTWATRFPVRAVPAGWWAPEPRGSAVGTLVRALAREHRRDRPDEDPQVVGERLTADVFEVKPHPLVEAEAAAAGHLPQAGDAGFHVEPAALPGLVLVGLLGQRRARAD